MVFPEWARSDGRLRLRFLCQYMAVYASRDGSILALSDVAGVNYSTALKSLEAGRMTQNVANSLSSAAVESGVKAVWLMAPELIKLDIDGVVVND